MNIPQLTPANGAISDSLAVLIALLLYTGRELHHHSSLHVS